MYLRNVSNNDIDMSPYQTNVQIIVLSHISVYFIRVSDGVAERNDFDERF